MDIINKIVELRKQRGVTQSLMAERLGIAPNNYGKIEKGKTEITVSRLEQIAKVLGVTVTELLTGEAQKVEDSEEVDRLSKRVRELEDDKKIQSDFISSFKQNLTEILNTEFLYTAHDLGLYDEEEKKVIDEVEVSREFFQDGIIKYLFNSKMVEEKSGIYGRFLKWREYQDTQNNFITSMFSGIGKRNPNTTSMKKELNEKRFDEKKHK